MVDASEQLPPQSIEAETAVLGSVLVDKEALVKAHEMLQEEDFYKEAHKRIFAATKSLYDSNVQVDVITVGDYLQKSKQLSDVGGQSYLFSLTNLVPTAVHVEHYANIVREKALLRRLMSISRQVITDSQIGKKNVDEVLDLAQASFLNLSQQRAARGMVRAGDLMQDAVKNLEVLAESGKYLTGVSTGFTDIDSMTSGLQKANLIVVAGRPSMGKTAFCLNIAENVAIKDKKPVVFFSLEMSDQEVGLRLLCSRARVNIRGVKGGFLARKHWPVLTNAASEISPAPLFFDFSTNSSIMEVRASARRWMHELQQKGTPLSLIVIDYIQLMRGSTRIESRQQEISEISRSLKGLARELEVPVIAISQLNRRPEERGREGGRPQLSDLRESGAIEQDADLVIAILREEVYKKEDPDLKGLAKAFVLKQRNGPTGEIDLRFLNEFTRFENLSREKEEVPF